MYSPYITHSHRKQMMIDVRFNCRILKKILKSSDTVPYKGPQKSPFSDERVEIYLFCFFPKSQSVFFHRDSKTLEWSPDLQSLRSYQKTSIHQFLHPPNVVSYQISPSLESETELSTRQMSYVLRCTDGPYDHSEAKIENCHQSPTVI